MKKLSFNLYDEYALRYENCVGELTALLHDDGKEHSAILIFPGGAYSFCSDREKENVALRFFSEGMNAFYLEYTVDPAGYPVQLSEAVMAMDFIRANAQKFGVVKDKVAVLGFSAGGHLASTLSTVCCDGEVERYVGRRLDGKPNATLLLYPVINLTDITHHDTSMTVSGDRDEIREYLSTEKRVDKDTPPAFICTTATDDAVPAENSLRYATALARAGVNYELHVFPAGWHGLGLADEEPEVPEDAPIFERFKTWVPSSVEFLRLHGFLNKPSLM